MVKKAAKAEINSFTGGLISEASPLNFPPNAAVDIQNYELNRDGTLDRRLGFGLETGYQFNEVFGVTKDTVVNDVPISFEWVAVNGDSSVNFIVVKVGTKLQFYNRDTEIISGNQVGSAALSDSFISTKISLASVSGKLVAVGGYDEIAVITWLPSPQVFTVEYVRIKVRDLWGVECTTGDTQTEEDPSYRPQTISDQHYYNLQNQSWGIQRKISNSSGSYGDPIYEYQTFVEGVSQFYPSNSEVVWTGLQYQPVSGSSAPFERMYKSLYRDVIGADVLAPKGYYIIDLFRRGQSREDNVIANKAKYPSLVKSSVNLSADYTTGGPSVVAQFAGRVFFGGFDGVLVDGDKRSPNLNNHIVFSKLVKGISDIGKCYQEGDPTSRENSDLVDTDGGFIPIAGAEGIIMMKALSTSLIIFAKNGVWALDGGSDYGFSATNYKISKISDFGCSSKTSVVEEAGRVFYWGTNAIYVVAKNQLGDWEVVPLTDSTIQTYYKNIPGLSKESSYGVYDKVNKKIRWLFYKGDRFSNTSETYELILDLVLNAFYPHKINRATSNNYEVYCPFNTSYYVVPTSTEDVLVDADQVLVGTDVVIVDQDGRQNTIQGVRYIVIQDNADHELVSVGLYNGSSFQDWHNIVGQGSDAKAYLLTGAQTAGDSSIAKQMPYLTMIFRRTENGVDEDLNPVNQSSCLVRVRWDWSNSVNSNKWSELKQAYRYRRPYFATSISDTYDNGHELIVSRMKQRGRGKSFAIYMETEANKDCRIVGWNINLNGNSYT